MFDDCEKGVEEQLKLRLLYSMKKLYSTFSFWFVILFPFFNPTSLKYIPTLNGVYDLIQVWKLLVIVFIIAIYIMGRRISLPIILICLLQIISITTSLLNGISDTKIYTNALLAIGFSIITEIAILNDFNKYIKTLFGILISIMSINCLLCLIYPDGLKMASLYTNWKNPMFFVGIDNALIKEIIPFLVIAYYFRLCDDNAIINRRKTGWIFLYTNVICFITLLVANSATGIVTFILFTVLIWTYSIWNNRRFSYKILLLAYLVFFLGVIVLGSNLQIISSITSFFGRTNTFTGRTWLWKNAINLITERPILGYGYTSGNIRIWGGMFSSHNMFLEMTIQGGLLYLGIFLLITFYAIRQNVNAKVNYSNVIFAGIFSYLIIGLLEVGINTFYYMLIILACYPDLKQHRRMVRFKY